MEENKRQEYGWSEPSRVDDGWVYTKGKLTLFINENGRPSIVRGEKNLSLGLGVRWACAFDTSNEFFTYLSGFMERNNIV